MIMGDLHSLSLKPKSQLVVPADKEEEEEEDRKEEEKKESMEAVAVAARMSVVKSTSTDSSGKAKKKRKKKKGGGSGWDPRKSNPNYKDIKFSVQTVNKEGKAICAEVQFMLDSMWKFKEGEQIHPLPPPWPAHLLAHWC